MLMPSERHKPEDLSLWAEMDAADLIHGQRLLRSAKINRSLEAVREFAEAGPCYASVSWGRDSVCLAHLVAIACANIPLVHLRVEPAPNPHNDVVRDAFLSAFPLSYQELIHRSLLGIAGPAERMRVKRGSFGKAFRLAGLPPRYLCGIRADESGVRRIRGRMFGMATANTCAPLQWWSSADVFGYIAVQRLPLHSNYAMLGGGRWIRDRIRVSELGGEFGNEHGRAEWEREYYGDILNRFQRA